MVAKKLGLKSAKELKGATVCVQPGTTTELNLADFFRANKLDFKPVVIEKLDEVEAAYFSGRCDAYTTDRSGLAATRISKAANPDDHVILPEVISKEPLAPAVRHGDDEWFDIVKWSVFASFEAERTGSPRRMSMTRSRPTTQHQALPRRDPAWARRSGSTTNGPTTSSSRSAITARSSTAMSARTHRSSSSAASTICGRAAG